MQQLNQDRGESSQGIQPVKAVQRRGNATGGRIGNGKLHRNTRCDCHDVSGRSTHSMTIMDLTDSLANIEAASVKHHSNKKSRRGGTSEDISPRRLTQ